jgi:hypothetical protein
MQDDPLTRDCFTPWSWIRIRSAGAGKSGSAQFLAAMPATRPSTSVQGAAIRAGKVHGTGKEVGQNGTYPQDDNQQGDLEKRIAHGRPTYAPLGKTVP